MKLKLRILACSLLLGLSLSSTAQTWNTVGNGLKDFPGFQYFNNVVTSDSNGVYVAYLTDAGSAKPLIIAKWNGLVWTFSQPIISSTPTDIEVFKNDVYVSNSSGVLRKYDGTNWSIITAPGMNGAIRTLEILNGNLICAGMFTANNGIDKIMAFDGSVFSAFPPLPWLNFIDDAEVVNDTLYILGNQTGSVPPDSTILKLNAFNLWETPAKFVQATGFLTGLTTYNNEIHLYEGSNLYRIINDTVQSIGSFSNIISNAEEFNGELYVTHNANPSGMSKFDGVNFSQLLNTPNSIGGLTTYNGELYAFSQDQITFNGILYNRAYRTDGLTTILYGNIFLDENANCSKDLNEIPVSNAILAFNGFSSQINANYNGNFSVALSPGIHSIDTIYFPRMSQKNIMAACPIPTQINIVSGQPYNLNLGVSLSISTDAIVKCNSFSGWGARYGFTQAYPITVTNSGADTLKNAVLNVEYPNTFIIDSIYPTPTTQNANHLTFNLPNISPLQEKLVFISAIVDTALNSLGDSIYWNTWLDSIPGDADYSDNFDTLFQVVRGAYDPNDKQASAQYISPGTDEIDYHIRFQNTGTDTAYKVVVVDTIDMSLPMTSMRINSASHPYNFTVQGNVLIWEFDNIMLPDSSADLAGSQGFINFTAKINPNLNLGDTLKNDADIYFDFQHPIFTNTAKTLVFYSGFSVDEFEKTEKQLRVFPNPAKDMLIVKNDSYQPQLVKLTDMNGRIIDEINLMPQTEWRLSVHKLSAGMYFISSPNEHHKIIVAE